MVGNLVGPYKGRRHDRVVLAGSGLLAQLQQHAWFGNRPLSIYGDAAYSLSIYLQTLFRGAHLTNEQKRYNKAMVLSEYL